MRVRSVSRTVAQVIRGLLKTRPESLSELFAQRASIACRLGVSLPRLAASVEAAVDENEALRAQLCQWRSPFQSSAPAPTAGPWREAVEREREAFIDIVTRYAPHAGVVPVDVERIHAACEGVTLRKPERGVSAREMALRMREACHAVTLEIAASVHRKKGQRSGARMRHLLSLIEADTGWQHTKQAKLYMQHSRHLAELRGMLQRLDVDSRAEAIAMLQATPHTPDLRRTGLLTFLERGDASVQEVRTYFITPAEATKYVSAFLSSAAQLQPPQREAA